MKKFLFFISTLFFILTPRVNAIDIPEMTYFVDFTSDATDRYLYDTIEFFKSENSCTFDYCSNSIEGKSIANNLNDISNRLNDLGYKFFITVGYSTLSNNYNSGKNIYIYILDDESSSKSLTMYPYINVTSDRLEYYISIEKQSVSPSSGLNGWTIGAGYYENYNVDDIVNYVETENSSVLGSIRPLTFYFNDNSSGVRGYSLYYSNVPFNFELGFYDLNVFTDYIGLTGEPLDFWINDSSGSFYDRTLMLYWYINDYQYDGVTGVPDQKPGEGDTDASNQDIVDSIGDLNNSINDSNVDGATDSASGFFENFEDNDHGLSAFITSPLNFIKSITNSTCEPITFTLPFTHDTVSLPCMTPIYQKFFGNFLTVWQMITNGLIAYWVGINCFRIVKNMKDPEKYYVEVMGL